MYIFPEYPQRSQTSDWIERSLRIGDYFDVLLHNKRDLSGSVFQRLAHYGITLRDNMIYILTQFDTPFLWTADLLLQEEPNPLIRRILAIFGSTFDMHLFTSDGQPLWSFGVYTTSTGRTVSLEDEQLLQPGCWSWSQRGICTF